MLQRRTFLHASSLLGSLSLTACAGLLGRAKPQVVVIGGGYGGATAAKYVRLLSNYSVDVSLVEPDAAFVSCPLSNLVLGGSKKMSDISISYEALNKKHGVRVLQGMATAIDSSKKRVTLADGSVLTYDKLVVSPGVELRMDSIEGLASAQRSGQILQAWKAGPETLALRKQLEAMPDGGVFAISIPEVPYRCPPGPYERACQVAWYFKQAKPRSKVLIVDANPDVTSKGALFKKVWAEQYPGMIEYRYQHRVVAVDGKAGLLKFDVQDDVKADVINALPSMRAGAIAVQAGLNNQANKRWCGVHYQSFESSVAPDVFVIGDSVLAAPAMPKSGHMANGQAKVAAAAIVAQLAGWDINPEPMLVNTCYSFVDNRSSIHVASVHTYVAQDKTYKTVPGSGGLSLAPSELEGVYAFNWARNIWADSLA